MEHDCNEISQRLFDLKINKLNLVDRHYFEAVTYDMNAEYGKCQNNSTAP